MRSVSPSSYSSSDWKRLKTEGRDHYNNKNYVEALGKFREALMILTNSNLNNNTEKQLLLSNIVACRLNIGGDSQTSAALLDAERCISMDPRWPKGHIRLASCYIALNRSNDACNSLQRALSLDRNNPTAKSMLVQQLRRDRVEEQQSQRQEEQHQQSNRTDYETATPSAPQFQESNNQYEDRSRNTNTSSHSHYNLDPDRTLMEKISQHLSTFYNNTRDWYMNLSDDGKSFLRWALVLIILYVGFGGRFGLDSVFSRNNGNNHYHTSYHQSSPKVTSRSSLYKDFDTQYDYGRSYNNNSAYHFPNIFDGSFPSMLILFVIVYVLNRVTGVDPMHAFWMLRMMRLGTGRGNRGMMYGGRGFGFGRGMRRFPFQFGGRGLW